MKLVLFDGTKIELVQKSDIIKGVIVTSAVPIGLIISCVLAYFNVDFLYLFQTYCENGFNLETLGELVQTMKRWYIISGIAFFISLVAPLVDEKQFACKSKKGRKVLTWKQTILFKSELILISQIILPLCTFPVIILCALLHFLFFSSMLLKNILEYGTSFFVRLMEKIFEFSGIPLTYNETLGKERYEIFLLNITFVVLIPYLCPLLINTIIKIIPGVEWRKSLAQILKLFGIMFSVDMLRSIMYMMLFFTSVFTYSVTISQGNYIFSTFKEILLDFVLLDTVIYIIVSKLKNIMINHKHQNTRTYYIPFKYDLEFALSAITLCDLKNKVAYARVIFSEDINSSLKGKKKKEVNELDKLLMDISTNYYKLETLEQKTKEALSKVINLTE